MSARRVVHRIGNVLWLGLSVVLLVWVGQGLFGVDQSIPLIGAPGDTTGTVVIWLGVAWGLLLMAGAGDVVGDRTGRGLVAGRRAGSLSGIAVGTVIETRATGLTVNDVPQHDVYLRITPAADTEFISRVRMLLGPADEAALTAGQILPVRYDPADPDAIALSDPTEPDVQEALLQWRIDRGLLDPRLVPARRNGIISPASVVHLRPTGRRLSGQVELQVRLLVTPLDGRPPWEVDTVTFNHPQALDRLQVGSPVYAQYEPHDPSTAVLRIEVGEEQVQ